MLAIGNDDEQQFATLWSNAVWRLSEWDLKEFKRALFLEAASSDAKKIVKFLKGETEFDITTLVKDLRKHHV